jgi:hypothetical protein
MSRLVLFFILLSFVRISGAQEVLRGELRVDLEPMRGFAESQPPLDMNQARSQAMDEAAYCFGAMIYGWSFHYDVGEKARDIKEELELSPLGTIARDDPNIEFTDVDIREMRVYLWSDYRPSEAQRRRLSKWRSDLVRSVRAYGHASLEAEKFAALEDAARAAVRAMLRGGERNRPKEAWGYISLADFPRFFFDKGQWAAAAKFYVEIKEIIPFAAY